MRKTAQAVAFLFFVPWVSLIGAQAQKSDGPAELPRVHVNSAMADTPAPGKTLPVKSGDNLQAVIDKASCGDTIRLEAGGEWSGAFKFPAKKCDDQHWIIVRTSAPDRELPPEGTRISPCYAGVASLPGRPDFHCSSPKHVLARLIFSNTGGGPIVFQDGANHYRFTGLEITRGAPGKTVYNLAVNFQKGSSDHLIYDRDWIHGTAQDETTRGVAMTNSSYVAVVDSYLNDFHCVAGTGACGDSQAINGGTGDHPGGPYKIENNFLEASGENVMFGGGPATVTPADIEIRHNHVFKPLTWNRDDPNFVGGTSGKPFIVKNLFELKNAERVLLEGNIMENVWGGFTQAGFAILLTPKNQNNLCPICKTNDITIRYNLARHMASGLVVGTGLSDAGGASSGGGRLSIHDNVFEDIEGKQLGGFGALFQISSTEPPLHDLKITHNTGFPPKTLFILGVDVAREKIANFEFSDNLVSVGDTEIMPTGGGPKNCAFQPQRQGFDGVLKSCFNGYKFSHNGLIGSRGGWPKDNFIHNDLGKAGVVEVSSKGTAKYQLCGAAGSQSCSHSSSLLKAGSDGKDVGADLSAIETATKGVE
jgi:hypothetical protein